MQLHSVIGFSLCAAALSLLLRQYRPEYSLLLSIACGIGVLFWLFEELLPVLSKIQDFAVLALSEQRGGEILLKSLGICFVTQLACDTCRDIGENAIAARLETAGKAAMLLLALPMFTELLERAIELIG